jgi:hypothetical protein
MTFIREALLYLFLSRLLIVAAAITSLILGYRLFARGIQTRPGEAGSTIESSVAGVRLTVKNAAPGTAFALFGAILIIVMLIQSSPSVTLQTLNKYRDVQEQAVSGSEPQTPSETRSSLTLRGGSQDTISSITKQGIEFERRDDLIGAERAYRDAVTMMAEPMNDLAWIYLGSHRAKDALGLASLAAQLRADEPRYVDTLNKVRSASHQ